MSSTDLTASAVKNYISKFHFCGLQEESDLVGHIIEDLKAMNKGEQTVLETNPSKLTEEDKITVETIKNLYTQKDTKLWPPIVDAVKAIWKEQYHNGTDCMGCRFVNMFRSFL